MEQKYPIKIQGSCVTRDAVECVMDRVSIETYNARSSIASLISDPVDIWFQDQSELPNFERRNIYNDFDKSWRFKKPDNIPTIYDFTDERYGILKLQDDRMVTLSTGLRAMAGGLEQILKKGVWIAPNSDAFLELIASKLDQFCELVDAKGISVINVCYWASQDNKGQSYDENETGFTDRMNRMLDVIYDRLAAKTKATFFGLPKSEFVGDANHRWARSPYHYTIDIEKRIAGKLLEKLHELDTQ
nr:DUF6270 domain-containing protein [uncultured Cohaesibacter sp.]